jgi:hypothetical protein
MAAVLSLELCCCGNTNTGNCPANRTLLRAQVRMHVLTASQAVVPHSRAGLKILVFDPRYALLRLLHLRCARAATHRDDAVHAPRSVFCLYSTQDFTI